MNIELVKTLAQIIKNLSKEERHLLEAELHPAQNDWETTKQIIIERNQKISQQLGGKSLDSFIDEVFEQMREERSEQLMQAGAPESFKAKEYD
jgi:hypothetical protein